MGKRFLGLDGLKHFWSKAKTWILEQINTEVTSKIAEVVANAPEDLNTLKEIADWISTHSNDASAMNSQIIQNQNDIKSLQSLIGNIVGDCPVGTILSGLYTTAPDGFLLCNGQEVAIADYFELYTVIGALAECQSENEGMFKIPDLREVVLVGAGTNDSLSIANHDTYNVGEFKDDQLQGHYHTIYGGWDYGQGGNILQTTNKGEANYQTVKKGDIVTDDTNGTPRTGATTHGKQIGVTYIIKY